MSPRAKKPEKATGIVSDQIMVRLKIFRLLKDKWNKFLDQQVWVLKELWPIEPLSKDSTKVFKSGSLLKQATALNVGTMTKEKTIFLSPKASSKEKTELARQ